MREEFVDECVVRILSKLALSDPKHYLGSLTQEEIWQVGGAYAGGRMRTDPNVYYGIGTDIAAHALKAPRYQGWWGKNIEHSATNIHSSSNASLQLIREGQRLDSKIYLPVGSTEDGIITFIPDEMHFYPFEHPLHTKEGYQALEESLNLPYKESGAEILFGIRP